MASTASQAGSQSLVDQFEAAAKAAAATVEVVDRSPRDLCDAILRAAGDQGRILFALPQDLPAELFGDFVRNPRVQSDPTPEEWVNSPDARFQCVTGKVRTCGF